jgi:hypothetical protein
MSRPKIRAAPTEKREQENQSLPTGLKNEICCGDLQSTSMKRILARENEIERENGRRSTDRGTEPKTKNDLGGALAPNPKTGTKPWCSAKWQPKRNETGTENKITERNFSNSNTVLDPLQPQKENTQQHMQEGTIFPLEISTRFTIKPRRSLSLLPHLIIVMKIGS